MQLYGKSVTPAVDEGAKGEENSKIINEAIEKLSSKNGGTVVIPAGEYKISTIELKSDVALFVLKGAKLVSLKCEENETSENPLNEAVVIANDARNHIRKLNNCMDVNINNIILNESAIWMLAINGCDDVQVDNCYFFMPDGMTFGYSGIAVESADGSVIENVEISDIEMDGISSPLLIWLGNRLKYDEKNVGGISDISIKNVQVKKAEMPSAITGCEADGKTYYVQNVTLENFKVTYRDTKENLSVKKSVSEKSMCDYPEITRVSHSYFIDHKFSGYWDLPCYGMFVRHAKNVDYSGYTCTPRSCSELEFDYVEDLKTEKPE